MSRDGDDRRKRDWEIFEESFTATNERRVEDISLDVFYKPHTLTLLLGCVLFLTYEAFTRDDVSTDANILAGIKSLVFFFLVVSVLAFPNGPFVRPHPIIWRMVFGLSVLYLLFLQFILFQNFHDLKAIQKWIDPALNQMHLVEKNYAVNCSDFSLSRLYHEGMDYFAWAHFFGWMMKAALIRNMVVCWYVSISWEITELAFYHLLPNFEECWWDQIILDILICNGLGIVVGTYLARKLEFKEYHWDSMIAIPSTRGKIKRAVMQFTPSSWTKVTWIDATSSFKRVLQMWVFVLVWQISELNTFFIKHIFAMEVEHPINTARVLLIGLMGAPAIRQYYTYVTDPTVKRMGTQCWVYAAIASTEALICIKFAPELFAQTKLLLCVVWLIFLFVGTIGCVYVSVLVAKRSQRVTPSLGVDGEPGYMYPDSSAENLTDLPEASALRRRRLGDRTPPRTRTVSH